MDSFIRLVIQFASLRNCLVRLLATKCCAPGCKKFRMFIESSKIKQKLNLRNKKRNLAYELLTASKKFKHKIVYIKFYTLFGELQFVQEYCLW